jgi:hypothetical protein
VLMVMAPVKRRWCEGSDNNNINNEFFYIFLFLIDNNGNENQYHKFIITTQSNGYRIN